MERRISGWMHENCTLGFEIERAPIWPAGSRPSVCQGFNSQKMYNIEPDMYGPTQACAQGNGSHVFIQNFSVHREYCHPLGSESNLSLSRGSREVVIRACASANAYTNFNASAYTNFNAMPVPVSTSLAH